MSFTPIPIPADLQDNEHIKVLNMLLDKGYLQEWDIGVSNGHISSRWVGYWGMQDKLTSSDPNDTNYSYLLKAHLCRFWQTLPR